MTHDTFNTRNVSPITPRKIYLKDNTAKAIHLSGSKEKVHRLTARTPLPDNLIWEIKKAILKKAHFNVHSHKISCTSQALQRQKYLASNISPIKKHTHRGPKYSPPKFIKNILNDERTKSLYSLIYYI